MGNNRIEFGNSIKYLGVTRYKTKLGSKPRTENKKKQ